MRALYNAFPAIKAFGCCHEVFGAQELLASMVRLATGKNDVQRNDIFVNVLGLNHFTWFDKASWKNHDLLAMFRDFSDEFFESGFGNNDSEMPDKCFTCNNRVKFDLFRKYGLIAAAGDRHLAEFLPGDVYLKSAKTAQNWGFYLTSVDWRMKDLEKKLAASMRLVSGEDEMELKPSGEEGILLIKAICGLSRVISNVNLPNTNYQIANFPQDTIVETNAVFSRDDVRPLYAGNVPGNVYKLMQPHIQIQELLLDATLYIDRDKIYKAFAADPLSKGKCDVLLINEMIKNTRNYLPWEWRKYDN